MFWNPSKKSENDQIFKNWHFKLFTYFKNFIDFIQDLIPKKLVLIFAPKSHYFSILKANHDILFS